MDFNEKIKAIREAKGMTRTEVEKKSGISYSCIKELENGSSNPTLFTLEVLCDCYGVKLWEVLNPNYDNWHEEIEKLKHIAENGVEPEIDHSDADNLLCDILTKLGLNEAVKYFNDIYKWYA